MQGNLISMSDFDYVVDKIFEDDLVEASDSLLLESEEATIVNQLGDPTLMNYLMKFEQFLDDHDVYLFDGWEDASIPAKPVIEKFWCTFYLIVAGDADLKGGAARIVNDKEAQNKVQTKEHGDGHLVKIRILKRLLDKMEDEDQIRASDLADAEIT